MRSNPFHASRWSSRLFSIKESRNFRPHEFLQIVIRMPKYYCYGTRNDKELFSNTNYTINLKACVLKNFSSPLLLISPLKRTSRYLFSLLIWHRLNREAVTSLGLIRNDRGAVPLLVFRGHRFSVGDDPRLCRRLIRTRRQCGKIPFRSVFIC
jgi:hypothetical protein